MFKGEKMRRLTTETALKCVLAVCDWKSGMKVRRLLLKAAGYLNEEVVAWVLVTMICTAAQAIAIGQQSSMQQRRRVIERMSSNGLLEGLDQV